MIRNLMMDNRENIDLFTFYKMGLSTRDSGTLGLMREKVAEYRSGWMGVYMRGIGEMTRQMVKGG
jgi:hypothetical protein